MEFRVNEQKCIEAMLYLYKKAGDKGINYTNLCNMMFATDKYHLNEYGVPVTGDNYMAMKHGTVPSLIKDFLREDNLSLLEIGDEEYPFKTLGEYIQTGTRDSDEDHLSETDKEALDYGFDEYNGLSFEEARDKNQLEKAWISVPEDDHITYESMINEDNEHRDDILELIMSGHEIII